MKKSFLFLLLMIVGLSSLHAETWTDAKGNTWKFDIVSSTDKTVSLTGLASGTEATVPGKVYVGDEEYVVVTIQTSAFWRNTNIVAIEDMPACTYIGVQAFYGCTSLANVGDLSACTNIERNAFQGCTSLTSVGDLSACTSIGGGAFQACSSLASIGDLPACTSIESNAFTNCASLVSVGDLSACTGIAYEVFKSCSSLTSIGDLSACTSIDSRAFLECTSLTSVGDLSACTKIGESAFSDCYFLTSVGDLSACTSINNHAFYRCSSLTSIGDLSACTKIYEYVFSGCSSLTSIGDLSACTSIESNAFEGCTSLASIGDLSACAYIGNSAFSGCTSLAGINLLACTRIGHHAFYSCKALTNVGDLSACTSIGEGAFQICTSLTSIGDLSACTSIGNVAFSSCPLLSITIGEDTKLSSTDAFNTYLTIRVPGNTVETYKAADVWNQIPDRIISKDNQNNWDITIPQVSATTSALQSTLEAGGADLASVMSLKVKGDINSYDIFVMRNKMPNLHDVDLTDANIVASDYYFYQSYNTQNNIFPSCAFFQLQKLISVKLPKSVKKIDSDAFYNCTNLRSVTIYPGVTEFGRYCFYSTRLTEIVIPEGVTKLSPGMFNNNRYLERVIFPSTLTNIGNSCFNTCDRLKEVNLPSNVESIGDQAFYSCRELTEIVLPPALKSIGYQAFYACTSLRAVRATAIDPKSVTISDDSFGNYKQMKLYVPYDEKTGWNATYEAYYWHTQWGQFNPIEKWTPEYDQIHVGGKYHQHKGRIPGKNIHANFGEKAGYHLGHEGSQHLRRGHMKHNGNTSSSIIDEGDNLTIDELVCDINVNANTWYFFCFPFDVPLKDVVAPGEYVFRLYDGNQRAEGNSGWKNLSLEDSYLKAGKGYIFQTNTAGTLTITVANPDLSAKNAKTDLATSNAENDNDANWNFIGNPYLSYYELDDVDHDAPITYWNGSTYVSVRKGDDDLAIQPFQAFFVQKGSESSVNFEAEKREDYADSQEKQAAAKVRRADQKINNERLLLNITLSDGENTDKTRVVFNDRQKMEYEVECDASKFMSSEPVPQLYTVYNTVKFAINERPMGSGEVKLGYSVSKDGSYTIGMSRMDTPVMLIDTEMGITHDFQTGEYTFDAKAGSNVGRFLLMVKEDATSIRPQTVGEASDPMYFRTDGVRTQSASKGVTIVKKGNVVRKITK